MKKQIAFLIALMMIVSLTACGKETVSNEKYNEISNYVLEQVDNFSAGAVIEYFSYTTAEGVEYGYYYAEYNEIVIPDAYNGEYISIMSGNRYEADGGTYFGKPNNGTDWCFVKQITDQWYYYELHWA